MSFGQELVRLLALGCATPQEIRNLQKTGEGFARICTKVVFATLSGHRLRKDRGCGSESFVAVRGGQTLLNDKR